jgi:hypothetical protein
MALELVFGYFSDFSESVDVDEPSSCCSGASRIESSAPNLSSHLISEVGIDDNESNYCQCSDDNDYALIGCLTCGSWFDLETYCPGS